jgi:hypothetical protein
LLGAKIALGAPLVPIGLWISILALRRRPQRSDPLGFCVFLSGGMLGAAGIAIMLT